MAVTTSRATVQPSTATDALLVQGEYWNAIEAMRALLPKLEQLRPADVGQREFRNDWLRAVHFAIADSAYALNDHATAERAMARVLELHAKLRAERLSDQRDRETERAFMALVLARLGRNEEAQKIVASTLKFERELAARNIDSAGQRLALAQALYVAAVAGYGNANAQLAEAAAIMQKLPAEMQKLRSVTVWQQRIAEEQARRRSA